MNLLSFILLLSAVANLSLAGFLFHRRHTKALHFAFGFLVFSIAIWNVTVFFVSTLQDHWLVEMVGRCAFGIGVVVGAAYVAFTWFYPEKYHIKPSRRIVFSFLVFVFFMIVVSSSTLVQASVKFTANDREPVLGPFHPFYVAYMLMCFGWATYNLLRSWFNTPDGRDKLQVQYCLFGFVLSFVPAYAANFIMPFITHNPDWWVLGGASPLCLTTLTFYAIYRHRLMDIGVAIRNALIYGVLAFLLSVLFLVPFFGNRYLLGNDSLVTDVLIGVAVATVLAASLQSLQSWVRRFVDKWLFQGRYDHEGALVRFGDSLMGTYGNEGVGRLLVREIPIIMQSAGGVLYLPESEGPGFRLLACSPGADARLPETLDWEHPLISTMLASQERLIKEDVAYRTVKLSSRQEILDGFEELTAELGVPLVSQGRVLGLMFLGERQNDNVYTSDDLKLLGALTAQAAFALDNTRLYEQMVESKRHYETILRHMQRGVLTVDRNLRVVTLNQAAAGILGTQPSEWVGRPASEFCPHFTPLLQKTLETGHDQPQEEIEVVGKEKTMPCECETSILCDARGRVTGALVVFQDLTQRKRFEQEVRRVDRLASVGTLAAGIAHEIKNPLVSIQTFAQLLHERHADDDFRDSFSNVVQAEVGRINKLVHSLLDFSRPRHREIGPVHVHELMDRALTLLANELKKRNVELSRDYDPSLPVISGDHEQVYQVFLNLLQNAIQAMEGRVRDLAITTRLGEARESMTRKPVVIIKIADSGKGIAPEALTQIFDPFFTTKANGSGLGLSICHGILKDHGGLIEAESVLGVGSVFTLTFPVRAASRIGASAKTREIACKAY